MEIRFVNRRAEQDYLNCSVIETVNKGDLVREGFAETVQVGYRVCSLDRNPDRHIRVFDSGEIQQLWDGTILGRVYAISE